MVYTKEIIKEKNEKRIKNRKRIKMLCTPIIALVVILALCILYQKVILKSQDVELFGYKVYIVLTGSMKPEINPNDLVIVKRPSQNNLQVGDIITYSIGGKNTTVTHRIIQIINENGQNYYKTKGDNNNTEDTELVKYENIQGVYAFKISKIGAILTGSLTGTGIVCVFLVLVLSYSHASKMEDRALTREEARKRYNVYKYNDKEDANDSI